MLKGYLIRTAKGEDQTNGLLTIFDGPQKIFECYTLELPWIENVKNISCIRGNGNTYLAKYYKSPSKGDVYLLDYVQGRSYIEIHVVNYVKSLRGCIGVGKTLADINGDGLLDTTSSRDTMKALFKATNKEDILLTIIN